MYLPLVPALFAWLCIMILMFSTGVHAKEFTKPPVPPAIMNCTVDKFCGLDLPLSSLIFVWILINIYFILNTYPFPILFPANWSDTHIDMPVIGDKVPKVKIVSSLFLFHHKMGKIDEISVFKTFYA